MKIHSLILLLIVVLAFILRVLGLNKVPPELFGDELDVGYHAYSLLKTGRDYYGQFLPTYIHSFSEWRAPLLMYATVPFIAAFGLNEWGVRLPSAVAGTFSVWLFYKIVEILASKSPRVDAKNSRVNKLLAGIAAFFLAISPWHLQYSRAAFEVSLLLTLILAGLFLFLKSFKNNYLLLISAFVFSLTFYTYSTANVFTLLFLSLLVAIYRQEVLKIKKRILILTIIILVLSTIPAAYNVLFGHAADRYSQFSVFTDEEISREIVAKRYLEGNTLIEKIAHNKPIFWAKKIVENYASSFSPQFLFITGDITFRHSIHTGELYWVMLPLLLAGLYFLVKEKPQTKFFWLGWLFIAPIASSLTRDGSYHATRLILMLPPLIFVSAFGAKKIFELDISKKLKKIVVGILGLFLLIEFGLYLHEYWIHYPKESWRWWHVGYKEAMFYMRSHEKNYNVVVFNNTYEPALLRFLFWWQYPPDKFIREFKLDQEKDDVLPGLRGFKLTERYYFGSAKDSPYGVIGFIKKPGILYLVSQRDEVGGDWDWEENPPAGIKVLKTVRNPLGEPIFYVTTAK